MRSQIQLLGLLAPVLAAAIKSTPRVFRQSPLRADSDLKCYSDEVPCEKACMLVGDNCCNDGTNSYCEQGFYCTTTACCMDGQTCDEPPLDPSNTSGGFGGFLPTTTGSDSTSPSDFSFSFENFAGASTTADGGAESTSTSGTTPTATRTDNTSNTPTPASQTPAPTNAAGYNIADVKLAAGFVAAAAAAGLFS